MADAARTMDHHRLAMDQIEHTLFGTRGDTGATPEAAGEVDMRELELAR